MSAFTFTDAQGARRFGRYRIVPAAGTEYRTNGTAADPDFLVTEIRRRVVESPVRFRIVIQMAEHGDVTDDATVRWPESRPQVAFGDLTIDAAAPDAAAAERQIIFDPVPRVDGIATAGDPLFEPRANVYLLSGRRRRTATSAGA